MDVNEDADGGEVIKVSPPFASPQRDHTRLLYSPETSLPHETPPGPNHTGSSGCCSLPIQLPHWTSSILAPNLLLVLLIDLLFLLFPVVHSNPSPSKVGTNSNPLPPHPNPHPLVAAAAAAGQNTPPPLLPSPPPRLPHPHPP